MLEVNFRVAKDEDIEQIIDLCNECFFENTSYEYAKKIFKETNDKNDIYLVGDLNGQIVAHAKITIIPTIYERMGTYSILNHVCVKPEYRRHKIATRMLDEITKICIDRDCKTMELWSNNVRKAAHACYRNYGFHLDDAGFFTKEIL